VRGHRKIQRLRSRPFLNFKRTSESIGCSADNQQPRTLHGQRDEPHFARRCRVNRSTCCTNVEVEIWAGRGNGPSLERVTVWGRPRCPVERFWSPRRQNFPDRTKSRHRRLEAHTAAGVTTVATRSSRIVWYRSCLVRLADQNNACVLAALCL
jgi:hypothetical protein